MLGFQQMATVRAWNSMTAHPRYNFWLMSEYLDKFY